MSRFEKTILQIVPRLDAGGAERTTLEIAGAVASAGGRALVATAGGRLSKQIENAGGEIVIAPVDTKNPIVMWANAARLAAIIRAERVDLVHARSRAPAWSALVAARRCGAPFVTTYHGAYNEVGPLKRLYNSSMLRGDRVIANSRFTADRILSSGGVAAGCVRVIPRGVDADLFDPNKVSKARIDQLVRAWRLGENQGFRILLPARLTAWKGHETAIAAIAGLMDRLPAAQRYGQNPPLTLVFCGGPGGGPSGGVGGGDAFQSRLRNLVDQNEVNDLIHLVGDCADMPAAYAWADLVIAPSRRPEAFGRVAVEAGAMAKPVIASDHGGARETVVNGETGMLVPPDDVRALSDAIADVMSQSVEARGATGERARLRVSSVYSAAAMCDATIGVYRDLLGA